ncbi:hypothetical protein [Kutzneria sp. NPDC052558]|uniref:hypothetical protein n=1 Tax=Kutzneria sp. NPDC052558 TaxID=3364121 RepID=UPI0037C82312
MTSDVTSRWDGPWYRVRTGQFEASFLAGDDDLDEVCDVDAEVRRPDGSRWSATIFTVAEVERLLAGWADSGECLGGRYFWCPDGLIVREPGIDGMVRVIAHLHDSGAFPEVFRRLED